MFGLRETDDCRPVTWVGKVPVYLTTVLVAVYTATFLATTIAWAARVDVSFLAFSPSRFVEGALWQPFTYTFVQTLDFFSALSLLFFYLMAVQVEMYLGRRRFLALYISLMLAPAFFFALYDYGTVAGLYNGTFFLSAGFFIAFATLYPNVEPFGFIAMKWLAVIAIVLGSMSYIGGHNWAALTALLMVCALSFSYVRALQLGGVPEALRAIYEKLKLKPRVVLPYRQIRKKTDTLPEEPDVVESIDPLLEKISKHGLNSLTEPERDKLELARLALLKKG